MTIVIIGHGASPTGKRWGLKIDGCTLVIRMWNWDWQNVPDYGWRYDYGFYEISSKEMMRFHHHNASYPVHGWIGSKLTPYDGELPKRTEIIDPERWYCAAIQMGGEGAGRKRLKLTRGVRAAAWAIEKASKDDRLVLVGFDNVYAGRALTITEGYPDAFVKYPGGFPFRDYVGGGTKYRSHDYAIEGPFLQKLADRHKVELVHAQDVW